MFVRKVYLVVLEIKSTLIVARGSIEGNQMPTRPPEKTRLTTFYESRTRKAVEGLWAASRFAPLVAEVETALAGLQESFDH